MLLLILSKVLSSLAVISLPQRTLSSCGELLWELLATANQDCVEGAQSYIHLSLDLVHREQHLEGGLGIEWFSFRHSLAGFS